MIIKYSHRWDESLEWWVYKGSLVYGGELYSISHAWAKQYFDWMTLSEKKSEIYRVRLKMQKQLQYTVTHRPSKAETI